MLWLWNVTVRFFTTNFTGSFICGAVHRGRVQYIQYGIDGLVQERRNSIANALELRHSCTNPSIWYVLCFRYIEVSVDSCDIFIVIHQGLYALSSKTSYNKISWSLETARFGFRTFPIALKFERPLCSSAVEIPIEFQSNTTAAKYSLAASRLRDEIWQ